MLINKEPDRKLNQKEIADFLDVCKRIDEERPNSDDVEKVKKMLSYNSYLWEKEYGLSGSALYYYIERIEKRKSEQLVIEAEAKYIKEQLGYFSVNQIERLIIDQILLRWVGIVHIEKRLLILMTEEDRIVWDSSYWQKTLIRYQNLYLRAIEMLAKVRKLNKSIAFQVNIATNGGQQVNVNELEKG